MLNRENKTAGNLENAVKSRLLAIFDFKEKYRILSQIGVVFNLIGVKIAHGFDAKMTDRDMKLCEEYRVIHSKHIFKGESSDVVAYKICLSFLYNSRVLFRARRIKSS